MKTWIILLIFYSIEIFAIEMMPSDTAADKCDLNVTSSIALHAFSRAKTAECKLNIKSLACRLSRQERTRDFYHNNRRRCKLADQVRQAFHDDDFSGCISQSAIEKLLDLNEPDLIDEAGSQSTSIVSNHDYYFYNSCIDNCLSKIGFKFVVLNKTKCFCLNDTHSVRDDQQHKFLDNKMHECNSNNYLKVFPIGLLNYTMGFKSNVFESGRLVYSQIRELFNQMKSEEKLPRIVFLLSLSGRSVRQVNRLIKTIYTDHNYYYIHLDGRAKFLKQQLNKDLKGYQNILVANWSMEIVWSGGSSLLHMHLRAMNELRRLKEERKWNWSYLINLSESDFPLKSIEELNIYLSQFDDYNFIRFHSMSIKEFMAKQSFAYLECDNHLWRVTERPVPKGLQLAGGSDRFCLHFNFVNYVLTTGDEFVLDLKQFYEYSLFPSESFFHTVLLNSPFCDRFIDSNIRFSNQNQSKDGSPSYFTYQNWPDLKSLKDKPLFFAEKFDPIFGGLIINRMDQAIYGLYSTNLKSLHSYWHNFYDKNTAAAADDDASKLPAKYVLLFNYFVHKSLSHLKFKLVSSNYLKLNQHINEKMIELSSTSFEKSFQLLNQVNSFFEADIFNGLAMNVKLNLTDLNISISFETLFRPVKNITTSSLELDPVNDVRAMRDLKRKGQLVLNNLISIEVSTDYDPKEHRFRSNYAAVLDVLDSPIVKLEFDPMNETVYLFYSWIDPDDNQVVKSSVTLYNTMDENLLIFLKLLEPTKEMKSGIWTLNLTVEENGSVVDLLTLKFLILETNEERFIDADFDLIELFWRLDSICVNELADSDWEQSSFFSDDILPNCKTNVNSYWSSHYPDPKSDLSDLKSIHNHRVA